MGLTIHFTLRLPASLPRDAVRARLSALHGAISALPMRSQTRLVDIDAAAIRHAQADRSRSPWRWAVTQHHRHFAYRYDDRGIPALVGDHAFGAGTIYSAIPPRHLIGFTCLPGSDCEPLNLFLGSFPASVLVDCTGDQHGYPSGKRRLMLPGGQWIGSAFCKTQNASAPEVGGVTNFLKCHLVVIAALDTARDLGFTVEVHDEGGYWEQRSVPRLVREVGDWNAMILAVGAQLRASHGDQVHCALTPERAAAAVRSDLAAVLGDEVLDLIIRTSGSTVDADVAATPTPSAT